MDTSFATSAPWDVIVIGSGMGGMVAGAALSRLGHRVLLLEQYHSLGGQTHSFSRNGFPVGRGPALSGRIWTRSDGRIKQFTTLLTLRTRRRFPDLFTCGDYEPLTIVGPFADNIVAFARRHRHHYAVVIVPRLSVGVAGFGGPPPLGELWRDTAVVLPNLASTHILCDVFCQRIVPLATNYESPHAVVRVADALRHFSVALLMLASPDGNDT